MERTHKHITTALAVALLMPANLTTGIATIIREIHNSTGVTYGEESLQRYSNVNVLLQENYIA